MRLSDLRDLRVKTVDGESLGRVHEVHCEGGRITAVICGSGSFMERLTAKKGGRRIPWECVKRIDRKEMVVTPDPPQRKAGTRKASATRSRRGTRQPSGPRSAR